MIKLTGEGGGGSGHGGGGGDGGGHVVPGELGLSLPLLPLQGAGLHLRGSNTLHVPRMLNVIVYLPGI